jgi:hypothetical protein
MAKTTTESPDPLAGTTWQRGWRKKVGRRARIAFLVFPFLFGLQVFLRAGPPKLDRVPLAGIITALATLWAVGFVVAAGQTPAVRGRSTGSLVEYRLCAGQRLALPLLIAAISLGVGILAAFNAGGLGVGLALGVGGVAASGLFLFTSRETLVASEIGLTLKSPWTGRRTALSWEEMRSLETDGFRRLVFVGTSAVKIRASLGLDGLPELAAAAVARTRGASIEMQAGAKALLEALAARLEASDAAEEAPRSGRPYLAQPAVLGLAAAALVAAGLFLWGIATRPLPTPEFVAPSGWVLLGRESTAAADFPELADFLARPGVVWGAVEPPAPGKPLDQVAYAILEDGEPVDDASRRLGEFLLERVRAVGGAGRIADERKVRIGGTAVPRVEVAIEEGRLVGYLLPFGARTGLLVYACAASECARVLPAVARSASATGGVTAPSIFETASGRVGLGMLAIWCGFAAAMCAFEAAVRLAVRRPATLGPARR